MDFLCYHFFVDNFQKKQEDLLYIIKHVQHFNSDWLNTLRCVDGDMTEWNFDFLYGHVMLNLVHFFAFNSQLAKINSSCNLKKFLLDSALPAANCQFYFYHLNKFLSSSDINKKKYKYLFTQLNSLNKSINRLLGHYFNAVTSYQTTFDDDLNILQILNSNDINLISDFISSFNNNFNSKE